MRSGKSRSLRTVELDVQELCDRYRTLDQRRIELDQRIMASLGGDQNPETLWQEQEAVLQELHGLIAQLASTPAIDRDGLRGKASVLAILLRTSAANAVAFESQAMAL